MKKNLPNDGLDKFLKDSFEGYEENPSNDVWGNISSGLKEEAAATTTGTVVSIAYKWWLTAAAGLLLCVGIAQYFYFNNKIENLTQKIDNQEVVIDNIKNDNQSTNIEATQDSQTESTETTQKEKLEANILENQAVKESENIERSVNLRKNLKTNKLPFVVPQNNTSKEVVVEQQVRNFVDEFPTQQFDESGNSSNLVNQNEENKFRNESSSDRKNDLSEKSIFNENISKEQRAEIVIAQLNQVNNFLKVDEDFKFKLPTVNKIIPISKMKNGISIMPFAGYYQSRERIDFTGKGIIPSGIPPHHLRNVDGDFNGNIRQLGLKIDFGLKGNWRIETGIAYRLETLQAIQNITTQYKDRRGQGSNSPPDFRFFINTGDGLADVEIKAKKTMNEPISSNEEIPFVLDIKRKRTNFSVPLKLNYQSEIGSWIFGGGVGLVVNIPMENELEIDAMLNHEKLDLKNEAPRLYNRKTSGIGTDAIASLSFGYKLTEKMSFVISPSFMYHLKSNQEKDRFVKDINVASFGSDVGVRYSF